MVPADSHPVSRAGYYLGSFLESAAFRLRAYHPLRPIFPDRSTRQLIFYSIANWWFRLKVPLPRRCNGHRLTQRRFGLFPFRSPLLGESRFLSIPVGTEMFQFPTFPTSWLWIHHGLPRHYPRRVTASRKSTDQCLISGSPWLIAAIPRPS